MNNIDYRLIAETIMVKRFITELYPKGIVSLVSDTYDFFGVVDKILPFLKEDILNREPDELGLAKLTIRPDSGVPEDILCGTAVTIPDSYDFEELGEVRDWVMDWVSDNGDTFDFAVNYKTEHSKVFRHKGKYFNAVVSVSSTSYDRRNCVDIINLVNLEWIEEIEPTPEMKGAVQCLWDTFGGTKTDKGYKQLNERVGLIYGDSITLERAETIMSRLKEMGFSSTNVVFGIGSYTYQYLTRDTFGFAMKATYGVVNGEPREIFKDPVTDSGTKKSAKGLLRVGKNADGYVLYDQQTKEQEQRGELKTVFKDGELVLETSLSEIRNRLSS